MTEDEPTPEELREAEALARALEGDARATGAEDAREIAALLRYVDDPHLDPERARGVRATLVRSPKRPSNRALLLSAPLVAAAALVFVWLEQTRDAPPLAASVVRGDREVAQAARALLDAQVRALDGRDRDLTSLASASADYRKRMLLAAVEQGP